jgi:hypothetical protein
VEEGFESFSVSHDAGETAVDFRVVIHRDEAERELSRIS